MELMNELIDHSMVGLMITITKWNLSKDNFTEGELSKI